MTNITFARLYEREDGEQALLVKDRDSDGNHAFVIRFNTLKGNHARIAAGFDDAAARDAAFESMTEADVWEIVDDNKAGPL